MKQSSYAATWHTRRDVMRLFRSLGVPVTVRTAIQLPSGDFVARLVERLCPSRSLWGGFLLVVGEPR